MGVDPVALHWLLSLLCCVSLALKMRHETVALWVLLLIRGAAKREENNILYRLGVRASEVKKLILKSFYRFDSR